MKFEHLLPSLPTGVRDKRCCDVFVFAQAVMYGCTYTVRTYIYGDWCVQCEFKISSTLNLLFSAGISEIVEFRGGCYSSKETYFLSTILIEIRISWIIPYQFKLTSRLCFLTTLIHRLLHFDTFIIFYSKLKSMLSIEIYLPYTSLLQFLRSSKSLSEIQIYQHSSFSKSKDHMAYIVEEILRSSLKCGRSTQKYVRSFDGKSQLILWDVEIIAHNDYIPYFKRKFKRQSILCGMHIFTMHNSLHMNLSFENFHL